MNARTAMFEHLPNLRPRRAHATALALAALCMLAGCDEVSAYRTRSGEVFHGEVIGSTTEPSTPSFIREGFESHTEMDLTFDPALAVTAGPGRRSDAEDPAGTLNTYMCPPETDLCPAGDRTPGTFVDTEIEAIPSLGHDALSEYDFPGGGRLRNYILSAHFPGQTDAGEVDRNALVFISLMENGQIEVRVIGASVRDAEGEDALPSLFGVFVLERRRP